MRVDAVLTTAVIVEADADPEFESRMANWRRWCLHDDGGPRSPNRCTSAEGGYPIPVWENEDPPPEPPDELDGQAVDDAVRALPSALRRLLRVQYVYWPDSSLRRRANEDGHDFSQQRADLFRATKMRWACDVYLEQFSAARQELRAALDQQSGRRQCA